MFHSLLLCVRSLPHQDRDRGIWCPSELADGSERPGMNPQQEVWTSSHQKLTLCIGILERDADYWLTQGLLTFMPDTLTAGFL